MKTETSPKAGELIARRVQFNGRNFYAVEAGIASQLSATLGRIVFGPWAIVENNGNGQKPVVIREGISGTLNNAIRILEREANAIAKAEAK